VLWRPVDLHTSTAPRARPREAVRHALIGLMAAPAQAKAEATKETRKAGINSPRERGVCDQTTRAEVDLRRGEVAAGA